MINGITGIDFSSVSQSVCLAVCVNIRGLSLCHWSESLTCKPVLLGAHPVGVVEDAAEVEHGKHGGDHHDALEQQRELKLLPDPARTRTQTGDTKRGDTADTT